MSTHDYNIANASGASVRSDINNALAAILSNNSNASDPSTTVAFMIFADTNANKLKIRNSANDAFIDLINLDGTIARDLTLTGASANIVFDQSDNALEFADNALATFGDGADLTISHNGSNNIINDSGVGELQLQRAGNTILALNSSGIEITDPDGTAEVTIKGFEAGNASLILIADEGDDNGDQWILSARASDNTFQIFNNESGGNVNKFTITTAGNVGIGTDSPSVLLDLESTAPTIKLTDSDATGTPECEIRGGGGDLVLAADKDSEKDDSKIKFEIDGNVDMTLDRQGILFIGTTTTPTQGDNGASFPSVGIHVVARATTSSAVFRAFGSNGEFRSLGDGDAQNTNNSYGPTTSDERLKENITDITSQWEDVKNIVLKKFTYKNSKTGTVQIGPIAQELQKVCPNLVTAREASEVQIQDSGGLIKEGDTVLTYKSSVMQLKAFKALQEAMAKIEVLETKVATLEAG